MIAARLPQVDQCRKCLVELYLRKQVRREKQRIPKITSLFAMKKKKKTIREWVHGHWHVPLRVFGRFRCGKVAWGIYEVSPWQQSKSNPFVDHLKSGWRSIPA